ncbi:cyclic GMP-AMP synthase DncV-like nucleotidyltransferase [Cytobacillus sp.]|uniref:nucleotide-binding domain-containing protein n=1 Tax=Cytobacillus sp. TaxID=2675269 RepID=UPI003515F989
MYDLNSKVKKFYGEHVVLPKADKNNLLNKKNINIKRLKEGLKDYNEKNKTDYKLAEEPVVQGSVAMSTVTQNESNDYDIDVAIIFEKDNLGTLGTTATKNMIVNALKEKCKQFNTEPEAKTNCVRIVYADGYHIDFAIYRRYKKEETDDKYIYEHCGSEWRERNPRTITQWFLDENKAKNYKLREVVRLLKMFCKSRPDSWKNMPGGLILSVLANEQNGAFESYDRMDERFYHVIVGIRDRLALDKEVYNPTDSDSSLKLVNKDSTKMDNLYNRLKDKIEKLDILFADSCTYKQAVEAWEAFFNHEYWTEQKDKEQRFSKSYGTLFESEVYIDYKETEEFIHNMMPVNIQYGLELDCKVARNGNTVGWIQSMSRQRKVLLPGHDLNFVARTDTPSPFQVYWKVKNKGEIAKKEDCVRGQIIQTNKLTHTEVTSFKGDHYVECFIVKNGVCVARKKIGVDIKVS